MVILENITAFWRFNSFLYDLFHYVIHILLVNVCRMIKKWATLRVILTQTKPGAKDSLHVACKYV